MGRLSRASSGVILAGAAHFRLPSLTAAVRSLDEKYFAYFFPHREASLAQGFLRFIAGARVQEFSDRKINPRLLLESQCEFELPGGRPWHLKLTENSRAQP